MFHNHIYHKAAWGVSSLKTSSFGLFYVAMVFQEASDCRLVSDSVWVVCLHHLKKCEVVLFVIMNTSKAGKGT